MHSPRYIWVYFAGCFCMLFIIFNWNPAQSQESSINSSENWGLVPLRPSELRKLILGSQLVAKVKVIQHWPQHIDPQSHIEYPEHSTLFMDKVFRGNVQRGKIIHFECVCYAEPGATGLIPGEEIVIFANHSLDRQQWFPPALSKKYELYYLPYNKWLDHQISKRAQKEH